MAEKRKKRGTALLLTLIILSSVGIVACLVLALPTLLDTEKADSLYEELRSSVVATKDAESVTVLADAAEETAPPQASSAPSADAASPAAEVTPTVGTEDGASDTPSAAPRPTSVILPENYGDGGSLSIDFDRLLSINSEVVGWLYCEGTAIDYPVVYSADNEYYLKHLIDGSKNANGTLFVDKRNSRDFSDRNTVLYGHRMKSGKMFGKLKSYQKQSYFDAHPVLFLYTPNGKYCIELFAGYTTASDSEVYSFVFEDEAAYQSYLDAALASSDFHSAVTPSTGDRIVTLSTCDYTFEGARYVVQGRLLPIA